MDNDLIVDFELYKKIMAPYLESVVQCFPTESTPYIEWYKSIHAFKEGFPDVFLRREFLKNLQEKDQGINRAINKGKKLANIKRSKSKKPLQTAKNIDQRMAIQGSNTCAHHPNGDILQTLFHPLCLPPHLPNSHESN